MASYNESSINEISWRTKDGRIIPLSKLTDDHLDNILSYLEKKEKRNFFYEYVLNNEKRKRESRKKLNQRMLSTWNHFKAYLRNSWYKTRLINLIKKKK